jgi:hypothetical protein
MLFPRNFAFVEFNGTFLKNSDLKAYRMLDFGDLPDKKSERWRKE